MVVCSTGYLSLTMQFSKRLTLLICGCVLVLGILCLIQYRLVQNTYRLERSVYFRQVEQQLEAKSQGISDSLNHLAMQALLNRFQYQLANNIQPNLTGFQQQLDHITINYRRLLNQALKHDSLLRDVSYSLQYTKIALYSGGQRDTLVWAYTKPLLLTGTGNGNYTISNGKQQVGFRVNINSKEGQIKTYRLTVWNRPMFNAANWQQNVLTRMFAVLAGSVALIAALIFIFFLVFAALLRQKKIAEVTTDFTNNMTHELKTPLSSAGLAVKSLRTPDAKLDEEWYNELLDQLDSQHGKIRKLMDNVLTSALDKPIGAVQLRQISLNKLLADLSLLAAASNRTLILTGQVDLKICTDPDLLSAILSNLLDNALKYTQPGSPLRLNIIALHRKIVISLEDKGPGIERKYQRYLFQKFFRVPRADTGQIKGLGLGLYLSHTQASQLNGVLSYERSGRGGSIFKLILPYDKDTDITC